MKAKRSDVGGGDYEVGFGKPPIHARFRKGQSGNPCGRPKGHSNVATALQAVLNERVTITENGQRKSISKLDASMKQVVNRAAAGDSTSIKILLHLLPFLNSQNDDGNARTTNRQADQLVIANLVKRIHAEAACFPQDQPAKKRANKCP